MNKEDLQIDDFFRSGLEDLPQKLDVPSWDKVRGNINRKRAQRKMFYYSAAAAGVLLLLGSSILLRSIHHSSDIAAPGLPAITAHDLPHVNPEQNSPLPHLPEAGNTKATRQNSNIPLLLTKTQSLTAQRINRVLLNSILPGNITPPTGTQPESLTVQASPTPKERPANVLPDISAPNDDIARQPHQKTLLAGITVGYQKGFNAYAVNAPVISSFFQVDLNDKFSLSVQPALAYNSVQKTSLGSTTYHANLETQVQQTTVNTPDGPIYNYNVSLAYDSIQVGYKMGSGYWQAELPLYAHYKLTRRFSLFTGMALRYTGSIPITQQVNSSLATQSYVLEDQPEYLPQGVIDELVSNSVPGTTYDPSMTGETAPNAGTTLSVTYGLGLKFNVNKRLGLEVLGNKNLSGFKNISNPALRSMYRQPGLRLSVIYHFNTRSGK